MLFFIKNGPLTTKFQILSKYNELNCNYVMLSYKSLKAASICGLPLFKIFALHWCSMGSSALQIICGKNQVYICIARPTRHLYMQIYIAVV